MTTSFCQGVVAYLKQLQASGITIVFVYASARYDDEKLDETRALFASLAKQGVRPPTVDEVITPPTTRTSSPTTRTASSRST